MVPAPIALPTLQNTELIECWSPWKSVTFPNVSGASGLPALRTSFPYSMQ